MLEDDTRRAAGERLAIYAFVGLVVGLLIVMGHQIRAAHVRADGLAVALAAEQRARGRADLLVSQLTTETNLLTVERHKLKNQIEFLSAQPAPERIVVQPCEDRPMPAFPRESQFQAK